MHGIDEADVSSYISYIELLVSAKNTDIRFVDVRCYYLLTLPAP